MFENAYRGRRVLITGHTGFKGSWLTLWLQQIGATVFGLSLPPETTPNHWDLLGLDVESHYGDIRDEDLVRRVIGEARPDVVFHLAAQPLVRRSYAKPTETWATNVLGTANVLEACRLLKDLAAIIVVTTDKCYENKEWVWAYREIDALGGHDPYSASKAGAELVAASYRKSFFDIPTSALLATARAGNVVGGGDWSHDRLIPDIVRSVTSGTQLQIRSPNATRPWQHVLECLSGYLALGQRMLGGDRSFAEAWNFGPEHDGNRQVHQVLSQLKQHWPSVDWVSPGEPQLHEAQLLHVDSAKARDRLKWQPVWTFDEGIAATGDWYHAWLDRKEVISSDQIQKFLNDARKRNISWAAGP